jgi:hypothetical protein
MDIPKANNIQIGKKNLLMEEKQNNLEDDFTNLNSFIDENFNNISKQNDLEDDFTNLNSFIDEKFDNKKESKYDEEIQKADDEYHQLKEDLIEEYEKNQTIAELNRTNNGKYLFYNLHNIINLEENIVIKLSHNMDFGNLKYIIYKFKNTENFLNYNILFLDDLERLYDGIISTSDCFRILNDSKETLETGIFMTEFLTKNTKENWIFNRRKTFIQHIVDKETNEKSLILYCLDKLGEEMEEPDQNHQFKYIFKGIDYKMMIDSLEYVNNQGRTLNSMAIIKKILG